MVIWTFIWPANSIKHHSTVKHFIFNCHNHMLVFIRVDGQWVVWQNHMLLTNSKFSKLFQNIWNVGCEMGVSFCIVFQCQKVVGNMVGSDPVHFTWRPCMDYHKAGYRSFRAQVTTTQIQLEKNWFKFRGHWLIDWSVGFWLKGTMNLQIWICERIGW